MTRETLEMIQKCEKEIIEIKNNLEILDKYSLTYINEKTGHIFIPSPIVFDEELIQSVREFYEHKIDELENKIKQLESSDYIKVLVKEEHINEPKPLPSEHRYAPIESIWVLTASVVALWLLVGFFIL